MFVVEIYKSVNLFPEPDGIYTDFGIQKINCQRIHIGQECRNQGNPF